jgi:periplasmic divalent cation tolerance protein
MSSVMSAHYPRIPPFHARRSTILRGGKMRDMDEECCEVVVTAEDAAWLTAFTRDLVDDRLAACGHHVNPITSVFRWDGTVQDATEARVALHTRRSLVPAIVARADERHPYDVPCVIALPLVGGNPAYLRWIVAETDASAGDTGKP